MTWSRLILLGWIFATLCTVGLYVRSLTGLTYLSLGRLGVALDDSILIEHMAGPGDFSYEFIDWDDYYPHNLRSALRPRVLHWNRLTSGHFGANFNEKYSELSVPLWFPFVILSALLWPLFSRAIKREHRLRTELVSPHDSQESAARD